MTAVTAINQKASDELNLEKITNEKLFSLRCNTKLQTPDSTTNCADIEITLCVFQENIHTIPSWSTNAWTYTCIQYPI